VQHLNLYTQLEQKVEISFSGKQQLWAVLSVAGLMVVVYLGLLVGGNSLEQRLRTLEQQQEMVAADLEQLNLQKSREMKNDTLLNEIKALEKDIVFRRKLLVNIDPDSTKVRNFSEHLAGLGRQQIDGMWFTEIHLLGAGEQLALIGKTLKPEYVPRYLQKLSKEQAFQGHQFRVLRMNTTTDTPGLLNFELRANDPKDQE
jgi:hypothetical protein